MHAYDAKATFFVLGRQARQHPALIRRILDEGHEIGNHTDTHPSLPSLSPWRQWREILDCHATLKAHTRPQWFRPPYGTQNRWTIQAARALGYEIVTWSGMIEDWKPLSPGDITKRLEYHLHPGAILLLHDRVHTYDDESALDRTSMLDGLRHFLERHHENYEMMGLSSLMAYGQPCRHLQHYAPGLYESPGEVPTTPALPPTPSCSSPTSESVSVPAGKAAPSPAISVVIPCFNAAETLPAQLAGLAKQTFDAPWEVIVADNGSTDNLPAVIEAFRDRIPQLHLVDAGDVKGPGHARNVGVQRARAPFIAFCDADDVVADGWLSALARAFEEHDFVAGPQDLYRLNPDWTYGTRELPNKLFVGDYFPHAGSGNMGIRRDVFLDANGFKEDLTYLEDIEFCWRVQKAGTPLVFVPDAVVHVRQRVSLRAAFTQNRRWAIYSLAIRRLHGLPTQIRWGLRAVLRHDLPKQIRALLQVRSRQGLYRWVQDFGEFAGTVQALWRHQRGGSPFSTNGQEGRLASPAAPPSVPSSPAPASRSERPAAGTESAPRSTSLPQSG